RPSPSPGPPGSAAATAYGGLVDPAGPDAAVDPAAARRGAVVGELGVRRQRLPARAPPVDLRENRVGVRIALGAGRRVVPGEVQQRPVRLLGGGGQLLPDPAAEVVGEPQVAADIAGRLDG